MHFPSRRMPSGKATVALALLAATLGGCAGPPGGRCPMAAGLCVEGEVTAVVDGDTLVVDDQWRIRLVLVDAPELDEPGGPEARDYLAGLCLGSLALIDEDDFQIGADPYGRALAVVFCDGANANAAMVSGGGAQPYLAFCEDSEFRDEPWTGC